MTLSRRDEFAARAMAAMIENGGIALCYVAEEARKIANELDLQLDRTAPKPEPRTEIKDDGREILDEIDITVAVKISVTNHGRLHLDCDHPHLWPDDARFFAHRILKLCDEIEGK